MASGCVLYLLGGAKCIVGRRALILGRMFAGGHCSYALRLVLCRHLTRSERRSDGGEFVSTRYGAYGRIGTALLIVTRVCNSACRALILAFVTAWTFPLIDSIGVLATNTLFAAIAWLGYGYVQFLNDEFRCPSQVLSL